MTAASESEYPSLMSTDLCGERHSDNLTYRTVDLAWRKWQCGSLCLGVSDMHERIRFISHQGKQILFVDFSNCSADEVSNDCTNSSRLRDSSASRFSLDTYRFRRSII